MSRPRRHKNSSKSRTKRSVAGRKKTKSTSKSRQADTAVTSSPSAMNQKSSTVVSQVPNKNPTSKNKSGLCKKNSPIMKSYQTSGVALTSNAKVFSPFYNASSKEMFQKLWLAPMTDFPDLTLTFLNGFFNNSAVNSFVLTNPNINPTNKNYLKTLCQSLQSLQADTTEKENITATRKIRIFPSKEQIDLFNKCFGATRFIYNRHLSAVKELYKFARKGLKKKAEKGCIHMVRQKKTTMKGSKTTKTVINQCGRTLSTKFFCSRHKRMKPKYNVPMNFRFWRDVIITKSKELKEEEKWLMQIPYDTRQLVLKDVLAAFKSCFTNLQRGHIKTFDIKFKSKKHKKQYFHIDHRALKDNGILWPDLFDHKLGMRKGEEKWFKEYVKKYKVKSYKNGNNKEEENERSDLKITREYPGKYYLHIPYIKDKIKLEPKYKIVANDPGVRTTHTFYSPDGVCGKLADNLANKLEEINHKIDELKSEITKLNTEKNDLGYKRNKRMRQNKRKRCARLRTKAKNIVKDYHWKAAFFLCKNFEHIIIPKLNVKSLQKRIRRDLGLRKGSPMIRKMMSLSHCKFVDILIYKAEQYDRKVYVVTEEYTSKTCGKCGALHPNLGRSKLYVCRYCGAILDRDINGGRCILIKTLV